MNHSEAAVDRVEHGPPGVAHGAAVVYDARGNVTAWSPGARRVLGHLRQDVVGRPVAALLEPTDPEAPDDLLFGGTGGRATTVMRHRDGSGVGVEVLRMTLPGDGLNVLVITPLPDSTPAADAHPDSSLAEWAFHQSPFAAGIHDADLRYVRVNEEACRIWGRPAAELLGRTPTELLPTPVGEYLEAQMREAAADGETLYRETQLQMPGEKHEHPWAGYCTPLKDAEGQVRGLCTLAFDISAQQRARQRLSLLNEASKRVGSTLDVRTTAREAAEVLVPCFADFVTIDLLDSVLGDFEPPPGRPVGSAVMLRVGQASVLPETPESVLPPDTAETFPASSPHGRAVSTGRSFITPDRDDPGIGWRSFGPARRARAVRHGMHTAIVVPLRARGTTLGVACFVRHRNPEIFDADDLLLAEEMSARAAVAMDNALRYTRERKNALTLQNSLLPQQLPKLVAADVAGRYLPSDARVGVGGDWYDVIPLAGARIALVVGDVVGHGIQASATMGRLRTAVRTLADTELPPDELLTRLDDIVGRPPSALADASPDSDPEAYEVPGAGATCLYAVYDPVSRRCSMGRAGHPPPAIVLPDGTVHLVDLPAGAPLGLGGLPFETREVELPEGSMLALYTDGLVQRRDGEDGTERLLRMLGRPSPSLEETCDAVLGSLAPSRSQDDAAMLLARVRALDPDHVATWEFPADPADVSRARELTAQQLGRWGLEDIAFTAEIVVSELVTNAIRYADGPIRLRLILEDSLIIEAADRSNTFPRLRRARTYDEGGRGLMMVAQLSRRWGARAGDTGKIVWAEQPLSHSTAEPLLV